MDIKFKPISNYVIFDIVELKTDAKIILPNKNKMPADRFKFVVLAIGPDVKHVKISDNIVLDGTYQKIGMLKVGHKDFGLVREHEIIGINLPGYEDVGKEEIEILNDVIVN